MKYVCIVQMRKFDLEILTDLYSELNTDQVFVVFILFSNQNLQNPSTEIKKKYRQTTVSSQNIYNMKKMVNGH